MRERILKMKKMKLLHYNFDKVISIPVDLYEKIWSCENLWNDENEELLQRLCDVVGEEVFEINCTT
jgi:hypothetical protein